VISSKTPFLRHCEILVNTMTPSYEGEHLVLSEHLKEIARNWSVDDAAQVLPQDLWPPGSDDAPSSAQAITSAILEVSRFMVDHSAVFERISDNVQLRLIGGATDKRSCVTPEDVRLLLAAIEDQESDGQIYRRADAMQGSYKEELLEKMKTTWGMEVIDIFPDEVKSGRDVNLKAWFHPFIPVLSVMTKVALNVEEVRREIMTAIDNRKGQPKGIGRPKKEDQRGAIGIVRVDDVRHAHLALVEAHRMNKIGPAFAASESVQAENETDKELLQIMGSGHDVSDHDAEPSCGYQTPSDEPSDVDDDYQQTPVPQQRDGIGRPPAVGIHGGSLDGRFAALQKPFHPSMLGLHRPQAPTFYDAARQQLAVNGQLARRCLAGSEERQPRTPIRPQDQQYGLSRPPYLSTAQKNSQREARDREADGSSRIAARVPQRRSRLTQEEAGMPNAGIEVQAVAKRKRDIEDIGERIDFLNFGYNVEPTTSEEELMKYQMDVRTSRLHATRFKIREERHVDRDTQLLAEGRAMVAQLLADFQESRQRTDQEATAAAADANADGEAL
jgi:hypothetical protein